MFLVLAWSASEHNWSGRTTQSVEGPCPVGYSSQCILSRYSHYLASESSHGIIALIELDYSVRRLTIRTATASRFSLLQPPPPPQPAPAPAASMSYSGDGRLLSWCCWLLACLLACLLQRDHGGRKEEEEARRIGRTMEWGNDDGLRMRGRGKDDEGKKGKEWDIKRGRKMDADEEHHSCVCTQEQTFAAWSLRDETRGESILWITV